MQEKDFKSVFLVLKSIIIEIENHSLYYHIHLIIAVSGFFSPTRKDRF